jgi:hypothetical protein
MVFKYRFLNSLLVVKDCKYITGMHAVKKILLSRIRSCLISIVLECVFHLVLCVASLI